MQASPRHTCNVSQIPLLYFVLKLPGRGSLCAGCLPAIECLNMFAGTRPHVRVPVCAERLQQQRRTSTRTQNVGPLVSPFSTLELPRPAQPAPGKALEVRSGGMIIASLRQRGCGSGSLKEPVLFQCSL